MFSKNAVKKDKLKDSRRKRKEASNMRNIWIIISIKQSKFSLTSVKDLTVSLFLLLFEVTALEQRKSLP